jgi:hypothetical protein
MSDRARKHKRDKRDMSGNSTSRLARGRWMCAKGSKCEKKRSCRFVGFRVWGLGAAGVTVVVWGLGLKNYRFQRLGVESCRCGRAVCDPWLSTSFSLCPLPPPLPLSVSLSPSLYLSLFSFSSSSSTSPPFCSFFPPPPHSRPRGCTGSANARREICQRTRNQET